MQVSLVGWFVFHSSLFLGESHSFVFVRSQTQKTVQRVHVLTSKVITKSCSKTFTW